MAEKSKHMHRDQDGPEEGEIGPGATAESEGEGGEEEGRHATQNEGLESEGEPELEEPGVGPEGAGEDGTPAHLGYTKYVHAAFFAAGVLVAYLSGKILGAIWNTLAEWPEAVQAVPQLLQYSEDERPTLTIAAGALVGVVMVLRTYSKESTRRWADEVAAELSKVTWPQRETVQNGTVVVLIATSILTLYIALLDRFWSFITGLVYGAA